MAARAQAERSRSRLRFFSSVRDESGQSVLEFVFMLPILVGLIVVMVRTNTVIQMSIVNQKYVRAQALWLTFNSPYYPRLSLRKSRELCGDFDPADQFIKYGFNRMVIGMADQPVEDTGGKANAVTQFVARDASQLGNEGPSQSEPLDRAKVRVRTTVALCTQTNAIVTSKGLCGTTSSNIGENTVFDYCRGQDE